MNSKYSPIGIYKRLINFISIKIFHQPSHDPEITVEFRHVDNNSEEGSEKKEVHQQISIRDSDHQKIDGILAKGNKGEVQEVERAVKRPKKSVTIKEDEQMIKKRDQANNNHGHGETKPRPPPRHWGPLLSVASNINEKCEAFISSRKRAMRRSYTLDPDQKS
ncbi:hypothetical protein CASFOL_029604 [Castilleja foliolosa]|uniref:Uncharacterized protein n=1 Tax=Castilleja foliolosa TaxID=1961234 RepID=A0ABD3C8B4_9LAMI